jgi:hypothetical protein
MTMKMKKRHEAAVPKINPTGGSGGDAQNQPPTDTRNVMVSHGIHAGRFPIGGMTVAAARRVLTGLINIDPEAIAVIGGRPVEETTVINDDVSLLAFVKPSALKG